MQNNSTHMDHTDTFCNRMDNSHYKHPLHPHQVANAWALPMHSTVLHIPAPPRKNNHARLSTTFTPTFTSLPVNVSFPVPPHQRHTLAVDRDSTWTARWYCALATKHPRLNVKHYTLYQHLSYNATRTFPFTRFLHPKYKAGTFVKHIHHTNYTVEGTPSNHRNSTCLTKCLRSDPTRCLRLFRPLGLHNVFTSTQ